VGEILQLLEQAKNLEDIGKLDLSGGYKKVVGNKAIPIRYCSLPRCEHWI
jgi:hypothetical protein